MQAGDLFVLAYSGNTTNYRRLANFTFLSELL